MGALQAPPFPLGYRASPFSTLRHRRGTGPEGEPNSQVGAQTLLAELSGPRKELGNRGEATTATWCPKRCHLVYRSVGPGNTNAIIRDLALLTTLLVIKGLGDCN